MPNLILALLLLIIGAIVIYLLIRLAIKESERIKNEQKHRKH